MEFSKPSNCAEQARVAILSQTVVTEMALREGRYAVETESTSRQKAKKWEFSTNTKTSSVMHCQDKPRITLRLHEHRLKGNFTGV